MSLALLLGVGMVQGGFHFSGYSAPAGFLLLGSLFLLSRSLLPLWIGTAFAALLARIQPIEGWSDQTFVQFSALASLLSGHGIYDPHSALGVSWSIYLPMADLLAAFPIWFLGAKFWVFFQVGVVAILSLPFFVAPSQTTFRLFLGLVTFAPFAGLTGKGSALEVSVAVLVVGFWLLLRERHLSLAAGLLAYGALLRQPLLFIVPFVGLALARLRAWRALLVFSAVLVFGGLVHVLRNPMGFFAAAFGIWADFADQWFQMRGRQGNFSISSLLAFFGDSGAADRARQPFYLVVLALALCGLAIAAWRGRTTENAIACAIVATLLVHVLNRGFVLFHYLAAAAMPAFAFAGWSKPLARRPLPGEPAASGLEGMLAAGIGSALLILVVTPLVLAAVGEVRSFRAAPGPLVEIVSVREGDEDLTPSLRAQMRSATELGTLELVGAVELDTHKALEIGLAYPAQPDELVLRGARIDVREVAGVNLVYPSEREVVGFLRSGRIEGSADGRAWHSVGRFRTVIHPSFFPTRIELDTRGEPVRFLRIVDGRTWWGQKEWMFGGISVHSHLPAAQINQE
ncbi:MAG: hypothetical protein ABI639_02400 [Thermoanaerobaculia bacterium]